MLGNSKFNASALHESVLLEFVGGNPHLMTAVVRSSHDVILLIQNLIILEANLEDASAYFIGIELYTTRS